jgi:hypothetical protein
MSFGLIISNDKLIKAINEIDTPAFSALDFARVLKVLYPESWLLIVKRYGDIGEAGHYSLLDYLSDRLEYYSQQRNSILKMIPRFSSESSGFHRPVTDEEKKYFDRDTLMVFHKK